MDIELIHENIAKEIYDGIDLVHRDKVIDLFSENKENTNSSPSLPKEQEFQDIKNNERETLINMLLQIKEDGVEIAPDQSPIFVSIMNRINSFMQNRDVVVKELRYGVFEGAPSVYFRCRFTIPDLLPVHEFRFAVYKTHPCYGSPRMFAAFIKTSDFNKAEAIHLTRDERIRLGIVSLVMFTFGGIRV